MPLEQAFEDLKSLVSAEIRDSASQGQRKAADTLNRTVRQLRLAASESGVASLLVNSDTATHIFCLSLDGTSARIAASRQSASGAQPFPIGDAPALLAAIETKDTVVTAATAAEMSEVLFAASESSSVAEARAFLIPLVVRGTVPVTVLAVGEVWVAALELLCHVAAMRLELLDEALRPAPSPAAPGWGELSPAERSLHLRAQRFAQVAVARLRVEHAPAVQEGLSRGDLYTPLQSEIDHARAGFREQFLTGGSKTMVDYLYLELVRSLANHDVQALGPGFPGLLS